jgi:DNA-binding transcriptional MerR regulator
VDEWTGYRYYAAGQARDAIAIRRLRELELPLDEIAAVLHADPATVRERLAVHRPRLQGRAVEVQQLVGTLDRLIQGKEPLVQETTVEAQIKELPALRVALIADRVAVDDMFTFVPSTIERLIGWLGERGLECTSAVTFLRDPVRGIENDSLDVERSASMSRTGSRATSWCPCGRFRRCGRRCTSTAVRTRDCRRCTSRYCSGSSTTTWSRASKRARSIRPTRATRATSETTSAASAGR